MKPLSNKSLEEFRELLRVYCEENDPECVKYPNWLRKNFWKHWTGKNPGGRKHFYQMKDTFDIGGRLGTFIHNSQNDSRWKMETKKNVYIPRQSNEGQMAGFESMYSKESFNQNK